MKKIIGYFLDLLLTLKKIEEHLAKVSSCVAQNRRDYGHKKYFITGHWNDK